MKPFAIIFLSLVIHKILYSQNKYNIQEGYTKNNKHYYLYDKANHFKTKKYDQVAEFDSFFYCRKGKLATIYSKRDGKIIITHIRTLKSLGHIRKTYQLLVKNELVWINKNLEVIKVNPNETVGRNVCGTVPHFDYKVYKTGDSTFMLHKSHMAGDDETERKTKYNITNLIGSCSLKYLNHSESFSFTSNNYFTSYLDENTFFESCSNAKTNIIMLKFNHTDVEKIVLVQNIDSIYADAIQGNFETFKPFIYRKNNLYGYFPINKTEKYTSLKPFDGSFARFELSDRRKGWLDRDGKEYFDE